MNDVEQSGQHAEDNANSLSWGKLFVLVVVLAAGATAYYLYGDLISLDYLAHREESLREAFRNHFLLTILIAFAVYVAVVGASIPGAVPLTVAYGWFFGFWLGLLIVSFASTGGAVVSFLFSRYLFRDWVESRLSGRIRQMNEAFDREGPFYLFTLRLIPLIPFFVINVVMGLTRIRLVTYWWVSQLGMIPGTAAYIYAGSTVPSLQTLADEGIGRVLSWELVTAFVILGLLPITIKKLMGYLGWLPERTEAVADPHE